MGKLGVPDYGNGHKTVQCIGWEERPDCKAIVAVRGHRKRCPACSDHHYNFLRRGRSKKRWQVELARRAAEGGEDGGS